MTRRAMNANVAYTQSHVEMASLLKSSYCKFHANSLHTHKLSGEGGMFRSPQWFTVVDRKLDLIVDSVACNQGNFVVWADVDIVFLDNIHEEVIKSMEGLDFCGMEDKSGSMNTGFNITHCSPLMLDFWKQVRNFPNKKQFRLYDQGVINYLLATDFKDVVSWNLLPPKFSCTHMPYFKGKEGRSLVVHFTGENKLQRMRLFFKSQRIQCKNILML